MSGHLEIIVGKERNGKTYWTRVGTMFPKADGKWSLEFNALPIDGRALAVPPKPRDNRRPQQEGMSHGTDAMGSDSDIPF